MVMRILFTILLIGVIAGMAGHVVHGIYMMPVIVEKNGVGGIIIAVGNTRLRFVMKWR
tara:strand:- start:269 stop:442 length:174 start_codon:yes stop_codon:yes gene_type:complete